MLEADIADAIVKHIPDAKSDLSMQGNHLHISVVSAAFEGLSAVKKQQLVYQALHAFLASGAVHAVHIKTLLPSEAI